MRVLNKIVWDDRSSRIKGHDVWDGQDWNNLGIFFKYDFITPLIRFELNGVKI